MKEKFQQFMRGRYGVDNLSKTIQILTLVFLVIGLITKIRIFTTLAIVGIVYIYFRMFSKNISKRYAENQRYLKAIAPLKSKKYIAQTKWEGRKEYRFTKCSSCGQELRVPKNKGKVKVTCKKCGNSFTMKT